MSFNYLTRSSARSILTLVGPVPNAYAKERPEHAKSIRRFRGFCFPKMYSPRGLNNTSRRLYPSFSTTEVYAWESLFYQSVIPHIPGLFRFKIRDRGQIFSGPRFLKFSQRLEPESDMYRTKYSLTIFSILIINVRRYKRDGHYMYIHM